MNQTSKKEWIVYLVMWLIMFLAPLVSIYVHSSINDLAFRWMPVLHMWDGVIVLLALFLLHNFFLAPLLIKHKKVKLYALGVIVLCGLFVYYEYNQFPPRVARENDNAEMMAPPPPSQDAMPADASGPSPGGPDGRGPNDDPVKKHRPPLSPNDLMSTMLLLLLFASNIALKMMFRNMEDVTRRREIERQNLLQELSYLKYQVNPHFLMNTLNNIHAMVDIDPEGSKKAIVKLSQLLRYMLYDGSKATIPLDRGVAFLKNYIDLMDIRYGDTVDISFTTPNPVPNVEVLPLLVITFLENAFKHGVSYNSPSYVHAEIEVVDNDLIFLCKNSKHNGHNASSVDHAGFGIANAVKRLDLIFGEHYSLDINDGEDEYIVKLVFSLSYLKDLKEKSNN